MIGIVYYDESLSLILKSYAKTSFKKTGWTPISVDVSKDRVVWRKFENDEIDEWCKNCLRPFPCNITVEECKKNIDTSSGRLLEVMLKCSVPYISSKPTKKGEEP